MKATLLVTYQLVLRHVSFGNLLSSYLDGSPLILKKYCIWEKLPVLKTFSCVKKGLPYKIVNYTLTEFY